MSVGMVCAYRDIILYLDVGSRRDEFGFCFANQVFSMGATMLRILVIDDDTVLRQLLCRMLLTQQDYEVHEASNGEDGLELIRELSINLVVTDIFMPGEGVIGTIMEICDEYPEIKIIAMSGGGNVKDVDFLKLACCLGAHKVFQRPFNTEVFLSTVHGMLH